MRTPSSLVSIASRRVGMRGIMILGVTASALGLAGPRLSGAAETTTSTPMSKTLIILTLDAPTPMAIRTHTIAQPPGVVIEFPASRVVGALPEHSLISQGVIQSIQTRYQSQSGSSSHRFLKSLQLVLSAPYTSRVWSEPGRILIEIEHPASVGRTEVEVGLRGGTIIGGLGSPRASERFRAMQSALTGASPTAWTLQMNASPTSGLKGSTIPPLGEKRIPESSTANARSRSARPDSKNPPALAPPPALGRATIPAPSSSAGTAWSWWLACLASLAVGAAAAWFVAQRYLAVIKAHGGSSGKTGARATSGMGLVDQLVWRAFERQGYQLILEKELLQPLSGTLRLISKEGAKAALLCTANGPFFEKQTVERFLRAMRDVNVTQGFLVGGGSFTVPAQRLAKSYHITLISREELTELLSVGAASEFVTKQLEQQSVRLTEAKETLRQYTSELDTLRRQRNEASWYLGEERAKTAKLDAEIAELHRQLQQQEVELTRWEQEVVTLRKQWEESQWYLGESQARKRHLDDELTAARERAARVETAEHECAEATWYLGEERTKREALESTLTQLEQRLAASECRTQEVQRALDDLNAELTRLRTYWGERRQHTRLHLPTVHVELSDGASDPIFAGEIRDVSSSGIGLDTEREIAATSSVRIRLSVPDAPEPIESTAQLMWQRAGTSPDRCQSGYKLLDLSTDARARLEHVLVEHLLGHPPKTSAE